eukprot:6473053-Alexandrium_andersonii.AAC.1
MPVSLRQALVPPALVSDLDSLWWGPRPEGLSRDSALALGLMDSDVLPLHPGAAGAEQHPCTAAVAADEARFIAGPSLVIGPQMLPLAVREGAAPMQPD